MKKIMIGFMVCFSLILAPLALASAQITMQNNSDATLNLFVDGEYACGPVRPGLTCTSQISAGDHNFEAREGMNMTVASASGNVEDGTSPTFTVYNSN